MRRPTPRNGGVGRYVSYIQCVMIVNRYLNLKRLNINLSSLTFSLSLKSPAFLLPIPTTEKGKR